MSGRDGATTLRTSEGPVIPVTGGQVKVTCAGDQYCPRSSLKISSTCETWMVGFATIVDRIWPGQTLARARAGQINFRYETGKKRRACAGGTAIFRLLFKGWTPCSSWRGMFHVEIGASRADGAGNDAIVHLARRNYPSRRPPARLRRRSGRVRAFCGSARCRNERRKARPLQRELPRY